MIKKTICLFLLFCTPLLWAEDEVEFPNEIMIIRGSGIEQQWFYLETPKEHLGKIFQDYNTYTLYDVNDQPVSTAKYKTIFLLKANFLIKDNAGHLIGSLERTYSLSPEEPCFAIYSKDHEILLYVQTTELLYSDLIRPFVLLAPEDKHPVLLITKPLPYFWSIQIINKNKIIKIDPRLLKMVITLLADIQHWMM